MLVRGEREEFRQALKKAVRAELPTDYRRANAILMDYAPQLVRERKLIVSALQECTGTALVKTLTEGVQQQQFCISRYVRILIEEA